MQNLQNNVIGAVGIVDQAVLGLLNLENTESNVQPRSLLLEIFNLHRGMTRTQATSRPNILAKVALLTTAGSTGARLWKEWQHVLRSGQNAKAARSPARVYRIASLAAASLVTAWLLVHRRH